LVGAATWIATQVGPGAYATPDSCTYLNAAEHLAKGNGYVISALDEHGAFEPVSIFAPLFSVLIGLFIRAGLTSQAAMELSVFVSFLLYALSSFWLLCSLLPRRPLALALSLALLVWPGTVAALRAGLSDLLGAALALVGCALLVRARSHRGRYLAAAALAASVLARWANLYLVIGACAAALWYPTLASEPGPLGTRARLRRVVPFGAGVAAVVGPVWLRNWLSTGTPMGSRPRQWSDPGQHLLLALRGVGDAFAQAHAPLAAQPGLALLHLLLLACCGCCLLKITLSIRDARVWLSISLVVCYAALLIVSSSTTHFDALSAPRFWLPVMPLLAGALLRSLLVAQHGCAPGSPSPRFPKLALGLFLLVLGHASLRAAERVASAQPLQEGLFAARFRHSLVVLRAIELADLGICQLSANEGFWLLPQIGTRPFQWLNAANVGRIERAAPLCFVLLREAASDDSDGAFFSARTHQLAGSRAALVMSDELAELWLTQPDAARDVRQAAR
jgi:hypothetical protein